MSENDDDEVINVKMPRADYNIMRQMVKDQKSTNYVLRKVKSVSLYLSGVLAAWFLIGDKVGAFITKLAQ